MMKSRLPFLDGMGWRGRGDAPQEKEHAMQEGARSPETEGKGLLPLPAICCWLLH